MLKLRATLLSSWIIGFMVLASTVAAQDSAPGDTSGYYNTNSGAEKRDYFVLGMGVIIGSGYSDALKASNPGRSVSGGGGWIYLDAGFAFKVSKALYITPQLNVLGITIEYENTIGLPSSLNSRKATIIFLPGIGGKYEMSARTSTAFLAADISLIAPASDLETPELKSGGIALGGSIGYTFGHEYEIALIYRHVPIKVGSQESSNLGGMGFALRRAWSL